MTDRLYKRIEELEAQLIEQGNRLDSLRQNLAVAYSILNDAMAEQDYHVDVSRTAVWLASNEGAVEKLCPVCRRPETEPCHRCEGE